MLWETRRKQKSTSSFVFSFIYLIITLVVSSSQCEANFSKNPKWGIAAYVGPGSTAPLVEIARFRDLGLNDKFIFSLAINRNLASFADFTFEAECNLAKHLEGEDIYALNGALVVRWLKTPLTPTLGKSRSTFAFGNGLSYASAIPFLERHLPRTSKILYHLFLELTFTPDAESPWEGLFRIHHRSGAFGLFNGTIGGSDFLCVGVRYRFF